MQRGHGYMYQSYTHSTSTRSRSGEIFGPVTLLPNSYGNLDDYFNNGDRAPKKILAPVATKPYDDDDYKHGSPTMAYPAGYDDEWHMQNSPVHGTMIPVATRPYGGYEYPNSYPYHAGEDDERYGPHTDDELSIKIAGVPIPVAARPFGVDEHGHWSPKKANPVRDYRKSGEVHAKRRVVPFGTRPYAGEHELRSPPARPFVVDEYGHGSPKLANPARDYGKSLEVPAKRIGAPIGTRPNGREQERGSPPARTDPSRYDNDNKWLGVQKDQASQPVIWTEWRRPQRSDAYNVNEEELKAIDNTNKTGNPINPQDGSSSPRKGTKLSETMDDHDIDKVSERFIQKTRLASASEGEYRAPKPSANNPLPNPNNDFRDRRNLGVDRPTPTSPSNHGPGSPVDAPRRSATIDCREAEKKYNGQRV